MIKVIRTKASSRFPGGKWRLIINGIDYTSAIPEEKRSEPMNTLGKFEKRCIGWNYEPEWCLCDDGLDFADWIKENQWVLNLPAKPDEIYQAFNKRDWRYIEDIF